MAQQQLLDDQTSFDGLSQPHVVGQQQVGARGAERTTKRFELIGLDVDPRPERCLIPVRIGGGDRTPAQRVDEPSERGRIIERLGVDAVRQALRGSDGVADLELPHDADRLVEAILIQRLQVDDMGQVSGRLISGTPRKTLRLDVGNSPG